MSDSERSALESDGRGELTSAAELDTPPADIQYVYYLLYDSNENHSKVAIDPKVPFLGRIRADSIAPPHSPTSIKLCIARVEGNPELAYANLFADTSYVTPLKEHHISFLRTNCPGLSRNSPMAIVQVKPPPIPDGKCFIKNRAGRFWSAAHDPNLNNLKVHFYRATMKFAKKHINYQWDIKRDSDGNISIRSLWATSSWIVDDITGSTVPVPWRLIPADSESFYLTTDMNPDSRNPRVPAATKVIGFDDPGEMATLKKGDQLQIWEFIRI